MTDFNYEFEITLPDSSTTYQYNDSPKLTDDFIDFLTDINIDITKCIYKVNKI